ncbi:MAG: DUF1592 domain-containing protein [Planctomycetales bacterium]|nr:DUF1592 domain-containing protein [Planctomycetales bacterium]
MSNMRKFGTQLPLVGLFCLLQCSLAKAQSLDFVKDIKPVLSEYCFSCHANGESSGGMSLDQLVAEKDESRAIDEWYRVLKQLQSGLMPPADEPQPSRQQRVAIEHWIKYGAFGLNPESPDPGRVTIRRLNQVEYRNTIRDLLDVDYDTSANFPADDTGHGFDNIGEVLSMSPLLLEKFVNAAKDIVTSVVPVVSRVPRTRSVLGKQFEQVGPLPETNEQMGGGSDSNDYLTLSYYSEAEAKANLDVEFPGSYVLRLNLTSKETYVDNQFDANTCEFSFSVDGDVLLRETFVRQGGREYVFDFERSFTPGLHELRVGVKPTSDTTQVRQLRLDIKSIDLVGPDNPELFVSPASYDRFFPKPVPTDELARRGYARELLGAFAKRAFRRPVNEGDLDRLVALAESVYGQGDTFESGISQAMIAILASPRFLFREESWMVDGDGKYPLIDEHSLASRLSYFIWSTMPDQELTQLADHGKLRANLDLQIDRMLHDSKAQALFENFIGQWLRVRAVDNIQINADAVIGREPTSIDPEADIRRTRFFTLFRKGVHRTKAEEIEYEQEKENYLRSFGRGSRFELTEELRTAMRREAEMLFEHIVTSNRSLLELVDCDYTFLNEPLWAHYQIAGIEPVVGEEMRLVSLPKSSQRGGVLTQGATLVVTSNPDRTSPVKRGLFILENILGTPAAAPPPDIPPLDNVKSDSKKQLSLRETLAIHRQDALCSSCHNQMDPLGLALENFNALGRYRDQELGQAIDVQGKLTTGESFTSVSDLKKILVTNRKSEIYRCITEKLMTYALGRSVEYTDTDTVDSLVSELEKHDGQAQTLVRGIIHSAAFQRARNRRSTIVSSSD